MSNLKTLITGASGLLGSYLIPHFQQEEIPVSIIGRKKTQNTDSFVWDIEKKIIPEDALKDTGTIIHLAGAGISDKRWTKSYKKEIIDSRVKSANLIFEKLKHEKHNVKTYISASAIGYYGENGNTWVEEGIQYNNGFLSETCRIWEDSALQFEKLGIRVVIIRIGLVLAKNGGVLPAIALPVKLFAGAPLGSGKQYMSWIHIEDLCHMFSFAVKNEKIRGVYNAVAPGPVTNKEFTKEIASTLHRPVWPVNVPAVLLKLILGEKAAIVLDGQRVSSEKIRMTGFEFKHTELKKVLKELL